ncbi:MAG TPA: BamA/TamA family outer membrane protein, partial [candidate division Zixibacteria bacterium]|nr:BamA/TamA family outer membrane protein [candidate division Zixibacteria bacterium]
PLLRDLFKSIPLWQSVFFDMGNGFRDLKDVKMGALAYGYGTGFQFISPAGPIRIDYARRIPTESIGFDSRWHFTILYAF